VYGFSAVGWKMLENPCSADADSWDCRRAGSGTLSGLKLTRDRIFAEFERRSRSLLESAIVIGKAIRWLRTNPRQSPS
jgi:hypothetical protein